MDAIADTTTTPLSKLSVFYQTDTSDGVVKKTFRPDESFMKVS
jgi:hypothetical protein